MSEKVKVTVGEQVKEYSRGTSFKEIAGEFQKDYKEDIALVMVGNRLQELNKLVTEECKIRFLTTADDAGHKAYKRSATLLMLKSIYDVAEITEAGTIEKVMIHFSVDKGLYCTINGTVTLNQAFLDKVEERMRKLSEQKIPINKKSMHTKDAVALFKKYKMKDKERLFRYRRVSNVNVYSMSGFEDYYYGYMLPDAGYIKYFKLILFDEGFVIQLPTVKDMKEVPDFAPRQKLFNVLKESEQWSEMLDVSTVGALNDKIVDGKMGQLILVQEALQEKKIAEIAGEICKCSDKKFVMIAGPSSSGKTSFSHRLSVQLLAHGMKPHPIALDNYFKDRELTPKDEFGNYDFECLEAIDVEQFNKDMTALLHGERVEIPSFNFKIGKREYKGDFMELGKEDILVIEGIHGLNDRLSHSLPRESKYKIYISALTQLNVDEHNRIPTTDGRLIRRMVRDARTRGSDAKTTLGMWYSVRRGEEENIFPYQEEADVMFNSALIYELSVLKQYAEPLLFSIKPEDEEYSEAKRLLKFLDYFLGISSEEVPNNSIVREFIGGSCFKV
ncbi:MAG: nucleoside kinase [Lachnospiraceae bacterium]|nr:nucleoside kinase [Lachnospiraceae bacterium]